jgi:beta-lactam-binding protein with PASTA domain/predicted Ser/Thr protein kinase
MTELGLGTLIDGRYRVLSRVGSGGMADVFLAEDQQLGRKVALKLLHRRFAEDPGFVERFRREARAAAGLQHPNVVGVYDRGGYDGTYYIAMEYVAGRSLKQLIRDEAPLDPVRAIDLTVQILKAARFAHRHGVIHRDLKPHNVIVDDSDQVKVTDFGIARAGASDMTETGSIMGTAQYLSPEQAQGHAVSASSDLYAIAVVLYEMLTGRVPFEAEAAVTIALKHVSEPPIAPTALNAQIPLSLERVVLWGLNKNPANRPRDADEFIAALEAARAAITPGAEGQRTAAMAVAVPAVGAGAVAAAGWAAEPPASGPVAVAPIAPAEPPPVVPPPPEERRRNPWPWVALLVALLIAGGAVAAYLLTRPGKVTVPNVVHEQLATASAVLQNAGLTPGVLYVVNSARSGTVTRESPPGGSRVNRGAKVMLTVSSGPGNTTVPLVIGDTVPLAKAAIQAANLKVGKVIYQASGQPAGQVISTNPSPDATVAVGSKVALFVSQGPARVAVPGVTGETEGQAKSDLHSAGFGVHVNSTTTSSAPPGTVVDQSPPGGTLELPGSTVTITVARAPATATVPDVRGQRPAAARAALKQAGFTVTQSSKEVTNPAQNGLVIRETPAPGSTAKKGSTVRIVVGHYVPGGSTTTTTTTSATTSTTSTTTTTTPPAG